jgi:hypothetical protein
MRLIMDRIRSLQDDKLKELRVGERILSRKHAVKWALIGEWYGSARDKDAVKAKERSSFTPSSPFSS